MFAGMGISRGVRAPFTPTWGNPAKWRLFAINQVSCPAGDRDPDRRPRSNRAAEHVFQVAPLRDQAVEPGCGRLVAPATLCPPHRLEGTPDARGHVRPVAAHEHDRALLQEVAVY